MQTELKTPGIGSLGFCVESSDMWLMGVEGKVEGREGIPHWGPEDLGAWGLVLV